MDNYFLLTAKTKVYSSTLKPGNEVISAYCIVNRSLQQSSWCGLLYTVNVSTLSSKFQCIKIERYGHVEHVWAIKYNHLSKLDWLADWKSRVLRALEDYFPQTIQPQLKKKGEVGMDSPMQDFAKVSSPKLLIWAILVARIFYRANTKKKHIILIIQYADYPVGVCTQTWFNHTCNTLSLLHFNISRCSEKYYINYLKQYIPVVK